MNFWKRKWRNCGPMFRRDMREATITEDLKPIPADRSEDHGRGHARQGRTLKRALAAPSHHSNAPIKPERQSILSNIVALTPSKGSFGKALSASTALRCVRLIT